MSGYWRLTDSEDLELLAMRRKLLGYYRNRIPAPDLDGVVADTLITAGTRFERRSSLGYFVFSIARRKVTDFWRMQARRCELVFMGDDAAAFVEIPESGMGLESLVSMSARREVLQAALAELPEVFREVVRMWLDGHDNLSIAAALGVNYNTVRSRLARGKALLLAAFDAGLDGSN
jgi:RNA polymerase sigma factor (sigma-70 family)